MEVNIIICLQANICSEHRSGTMVKKGNETKYIQVMLKIASV